MYDHCRDKCLHEQHLPEEHLQEVVSQLDASSHQHLQLRLNQYLRLLLMEHPGVEKSLLVLSQALSYPKPEKGESQHG
jgi:hypothetical protein